MRQVSTVPPSSTPHNKENALPKGPELVLVRNKPIQPKPFRLRTEQRRERINMDHTKNSKLPQVSQSQLPPLQQQQQQHSKGLNQNSHVVLYKPSQPLTTINEFVLNSERCVRQRQQRQTGKNQVHEQKHLNKGHISARKVQSSRPLTEPHSPALRVKIRHQQRLLQRQQECQPLAMTSKAAFELSQPMTPFVGLGPTQLNRDL
jgi:hypothetical protein